MRDSTVLKIVYALDIKFWVRWCTCSMWRMLLPYYLLFLISVILFLKTDIRILSASEASHSLGCSMIQLAVYIYIYMVESVRSYVSNTHAHVRMSVCY